MPAINKQPIFTATPILQSIELDPSKGPELHNTAKASIVYTDGSTYGSLITKITVTSPALIAGLVTTKRIYLMISDLSDASSFNVFTSKLMTGIDPVQIVSETPCVVFEFPQGLVTSTGRQLGIISTTNEDTTGEIGDRVTVVVEGGTYDQPV